MECLLDDMVSRKGYSWCAEHRFHNGRKWRFDYAIPMKKLAIEIEGAVWTQGRHTRGSGFVKDCEKYNNAAILGWRLLRFSTQDVLRGKAGEMLRRVL